MLVSLQLRSYLVILQLTTYTYSSNMSYCDPITITFAAACAAAYLLESGARSGVAKTGSLHNRKRILRRTYVASYTVYPRQQRKCLISRCLVKAKTSGMVRIISHYTMSKIRIAIYSTTQNYQLYQLGTAVRSHKRLSLQLRGVNPKPWKAKKQVSNLINKVAGQ